MVDNFARPYRSELYGRKPCTLFMDPAPLIVDEDLTIPELSAIVVGGDPRHLTNGFIITRRGSYAGLGRGHDLMREITALQIQAARYANPLTGLPGNVPIHEHVTKLLEHESRFVACYVDLDQFKPFNDVHGFSEGDELIRETAEILKRHTNPDIDFVGHIGGDDFFVLFQSTDWERRCTAVLAEFDERVRRFFDDDALVAGGYHAENRKGVREFHRITSLSIGATVVEPRTFGSFLDVTKVAAETKKKAKAKPGSRLHINQRRYPELR
jgi:diguanylate cyclase (GGDEF)-like protein